MKRAALRIALMAVLLLSIFVEVSPVVFVVAAAIAGILLHTLGVAEGGGRR